MLMMETKMKDVWREMHIGEKQFTWWYSRCGGGKAERSNSGVGRRLDYFLVEEKWVHRVKECKVVVEARGSDHCPVVMVMQVGEEVKEG